MSGSGVIASRKFAYQNVLVCMIIFSGLPKRLSYQWHSVLGVYWIPWPIWLAVLRIYGFIISHIPRVLYWLFLKERQKKVIIMCLNTVLGAVSGNLRDGDCFNLDKQTWLPKINGKQKTSYSPSFRLWAATLLLPWFGKWHILTNC